MYYYTTHPSPVGLLTLASDGEALVGLWLEGQKYFGQSVCELLQQKDNFPVFSTAKSWLERYFAAQRPSLDGLTLRPAGSAFRQAVWSILCEIPYGQVITYGSIASSMAERLGKKTMSAQAVGGAVGHNPISIIIPCHRVVGTTGSLTGYAGGIDKKIQLLELEGVDLSGLFVPRKR